MEIEEFLRPIKYTGGHEYRSNGVGDYNWHCPTHGNGGFCPAMVAKIHAKDPGRCTLCGEEFEPLEVSDG